MKIFNQKLAQNWSNLLVFLPNLVSLQHFQHDVYQRKLIQWHVLLGQTVDANYGWNGPFWW